MPRERTLQTNALKWLNEQDYTIAHNIHTGMYGTRGYPDIVAFVYGVGLLIETKTPSGVLSKSQQKVKDEFEQNGVLFIVARSLDDVRAAHTIIGQLVVKRGLRDRGIDIDNRNLRLFPRGR